MTWLRLDDLFLEHPKVVALTGPQKLAHLNAMLYACRHRTSGKLPAAALRQLGVSPKYIERFVALDLWEFDSDGSLWIHDFSRYNPIDKTASTRQRRRRDSNRSVTQ